jgi:hypothetical protein
VLAGHIEEDRQTGAGGHKDRVIALVAHQLVQRDALSGGGGIRGQDV